MSSPHMRDAACLPRPATFIAACPLMPAADTSRGAPLMPDEMQPFFVCHHAAAKQRHEKQRLPLPQKKKNGERGDIRVPLLPRFDVAVAFCPASSTRRRRNRKTRRPSNIAIFLALFDVLLSCLVPPRYYSARYAVAIIEAQPYMMPFIIFRIFPPLFSAGFRFSAPPDFHILFGWPCHIDDISADSFFRHDHCLTRPDFLFCCQRALAAARAFAERPSRQIPFFIRQKKKKKRRRLDIAPRPLPRPNQYPSFFIQPLRR